MIAKYRKELVCIRTEKTVCMISLLLVRGLDFVWSVFNARSCTYKTKSTLIQNDKLSRGNASYIRSMSTIELTTPLPKLLRLVM